MATLTSEHRMAISGASGLAMGGLMVTMGVLDNFNPLWMSMGGLGILSGAIWEPWRYWPGAIKDGIGGLKKLLRKDKDKYWGKGWD